VPAKSTYSAGTAFLTVVPSFLGIDKAFQQQVRQMAQSADKTIAQGMAQGLKQAQQQAKGTGAKAGEDFAGAYEREARKRLVESWRKLPEPEPGVKLRKWDKALASVRSDMKDLSQQRIGIDIDLPTYEKAIDNFRRQLEALRNSATGVNKERNFFNANEAMTGLEGIQKFAADARRQSLQLAEQVASAFNDRMSKVLKDGLAKLPEITLTANSTDAERKIAALRQRMLALSNKRIDIDISAEAAYAEMRSIQEGLQALDRNDVRVDIRTNAHEAAAGMAAFTKQATIAEKVASAFNARVAKVLQDGLEKLPPIKLTANSSDAEQSIEDLRARMVALSTKRIDIDISAEQAYAEIRAIQQGLQALDRTSVRVDIRTNAHEANAGLSQFVKQAEEAGKSTESIGKAAQFSMSRIGYLIALGLSLGTSIVPAALAAVGAIGMIGTASVSALAGVGVFALGISGISDAVKALNGVQEEQLKGSADVQQAQERQAGAAAQVRMAELSLANTRRTVAEAAQDAARRVTDAERNVNEVRRQGQIEVRNAARAVVEASQAAARAEREVGDARRQSRRDNIEAARSQRDAQRTLTDSERDARDIRLSLNEAIREATRDIRGLDVELRRNEVDQQKAVTDQMKALAELNALKINPRASEVELRRAKDAYDEQTVRLQELKLKHRELSEDKARADKLGVEGDERVISIRKRIQEADERVASNREKLAREQDDRRWTELQGEQRIADAQQRASDARARVSREQEQQRLAEYQAARRNEDAARDLEDAQRRQARQRLDGQFQIAQATHAVEEAQRSQAEVIAETSKTSSAAVDKLNIAMSNLSPAGQRFARFIFGLKDEMKGLRDAAAEPLLPRLEEAITLLLPYLPSLEQFIGKVATAMGDLAIQAAQALGSPVWQRFFGYVDDTAVPSLQMMFEVGSNLAEGLISLFLALTPFNDQVGNGLIGLSRDFAEWAAKLEQTEGYKDFIDYVRENGPKVVHFLGEFGELLIDLVQAAMPIGSAVLSGMTMFVDLLNSIPTWALTGILVGLGTLAATLITIGVIMRANKMRQQLTDIFGPRSQRMIQTYAIDTGRATQQTGRFGTAVAVAGGMGAAARTKMQGYATAVGGVATKTQAAFSATGPLGRGLDTVRTAATNAGTALASGVATGAQAAATRVTSLGTASRNAATGGLAQLRQAAFNVAAAANGPGGMAAGAQVAGGYAATMGRQAGTAAGKVGGLAKQAGGAAVSVGRKMAGGISAVAGMLGPWGIALAGASIAIGVLADASAEYNGKIDTLKTTIGELGREYKELKEQGKLGSTEATDMLLQIAQSNPEMQKAVLNLDRLGVEVGDLGRAAAGSKEDLDRVLAILDAEIDAAGDKWRDESNFLFTVFSDDAMAASDRLEQLRQLREAVKKHGEETQRAAEVEKLFNDETGRTAAMALIVKNNTGASTQKLAEMATAWDRNQIKLNALNDTMSLFGDGADLAARRADHLSDAIDRQYGSAIAANEASENWNRTLLNLRDTIRTNGPALDEHSQAGLNNRDALQAAAQQSRELWLADVRAGKDLPTVTKKHNDRIAALREEARKSFGAKSEADKLIKTYGEIDPKISTKFYTENFDKVFMQAQKLRFAQYLLEQGITDPKEADKLWKDSLKANQTAINMGGKPIAAWAPQKATGGEIEGTGTGTSDSNLIWASKGEHMLTDAEVKAAGGHQVIYAWRDALLKNKGVLPDLLGLPKHATGGPIGERIPRYAKGGAVAPFKVDLGMAKLPTLKDIMSGAFFGGVATGALGMGGGGMGWQWQMAMLRKRFPGLDLYSGPRPGSRTGSGGLSWHARPAADGSIGRAVDVPPRMDVFNFIRSRYGGNSKELIWGGAPDKNIWHGKPHRFSETLLRQHGPYKGSPGPSPHIHWAFDNGGQLLPGLNIVPNFTGRPEPVLSPGQWSTIEQFVAQGMAGNGQAGATYQFEFADTTLTPSHLRSIQQRQDAMERVGRPR
jgi:hypothetical protein